MYKFKWLSVFAVALFAWQCSSSGSENGPVDVQENEDAIIIVDRTGKKWDVTHAVKKYGFKADAFQFGLGPFAIRPILNPKMIGPGHPRYPDANRTFLVLGTRLEDEARAYPIDVMSFFEIADEKFGDTHVAVGY